MAYSSDSDIINYLSTEELSSLTGSTEIDYAKIEFARERSDAFIDLFLQGKVSFDKVNVPVIINRISVELTIVFLYENYHNSDEIPNMIQRRKRDITRLLQDIAASKLVLAPNTTYDTILCLTNSIK